MAKRVTPVGKHKTCEVTIYLADVGLALRFDGRCCHYSWYNDDLRITFNRNENTKYALYTGFQNIVIFPNGRVHDLSNLSLSHLDGSQNIHIEFNGVTDIVLEHIELEWHTMTLSKFEEIIAIPKPVLEHWSWRVWRDTSSTNCTFKAHEQLASSDWILKRPKLPSKLDDILGT